MADKDLLSSNDDEYKRKLALALALADADEPKPNSVFGESSRIGANTEEPPMEFGQRLDSTFDKLTSFENIKQGAESTFVAPFEAAYNLGEDVKLRREQSPQPGMGVVGQTLTATGDVLGDKLKNLSMPDLAKGVTQFAPFAMMNPATAIPTSLGLGLLYDVIAEKDPNEAASNFWGDALSAGAGAGFDVAGELSKRIPKRWSKKKVGKTHQQYLSDIDEGSIADTLVPETGSKAQKAIRKQLYGDAENTLIKEIDLEGIKKDVNNPSAAFDELTNRYENKLAKYQADEDYLIGFADEVATKLGRPPLKIYLPTDKLQDTSFFGKYVSEFDPEHFNARRPRPVTKYEFTAAEAKDLVQEIQQELRILKKYDAASSAGFIGDNASTLAKVQAQTAYLDQLQKDIRSQIDSYTKEQFITAKKSPKFKLKGKDLPDKSFEEINSIRHQLLHFEDVLGTNFKLEKNKFKGLDAQRKAELTPGGINVGFRPSTNLQDLAGRVYLRLKGSSPLEEGLKIANEAGDTAVESLQRIKSNRALPEPPPIAPAYDPITVENVLGGAKAGSIIGEGGQLLASEPDPSESLGSYLNNLRMEDLLSAKEAMAEEQAPTLLPRDPEIIMNDERYMAVIRNNLGPGAVALLQNAARSKNDFKATAALARIVQEAPDIFEPSTTGFISEMRKGDYFVLTSGAEAELYSKQLQSEFRQGKITDSKWYFKQQNSLKNPADFRIFPRPIRSDGINSALQGVVDSRGEEPIKRSSPLEKLRDNTPDTIQTSVGERRAYSGEGATSLGKSQDNMSVEGVTTALKQRGYSNAAIAGILGNIHVETGGTFKHDQKQLGGGKGYGLFQFDFMRPYYKGWLKDEGYEDSLDAQVEFMDRVITGEVPMLGTKERKELETVLRYSDDPKEIAHTFMTIFEKPGKPHAEKRLSAAEKYFNLLG